MIIVWGLLGDAPTRQVHDALLRLGCEVRFLDQRSTSHAAGELTVDSCLTAKVRIDGVETDLSHSTAAYVRPYDARRLVPVRRAGPASPIWDRAERMDQLLSDWSELTEALVVNRPSAMAPNASKPFQARQFRGAGFSTPDTLVTTDPDAVREFRATHGRVIYKSVSGVRSIVSELSDERMARLESVRWCPTQFQQLLVGIDYRVHVVGQQIFAAEIRSDAIDYRYAHRFGRHITIRPATIPDDVAGRCITASRSLGLPFSGLDLKLTPEGRWYCFEMNPSPGFTFFQDATGQRIAEAVARLLAGATNTATETPTAAVATV